MGQKHGRMEEKGMYIVNDKLITWIGDIRRKETNLDLIFGSEEIADGISYRQERESWRSDHISVIVKIRHEKKIYVKKSNRLSSGKTDWEKYRKGIRLRQDKMMENKECEIMERYNRFCIIMKEEVCKVTGKEYIGDEENKDIEGKTIIGRDKGKGENDKGK